MLRRLEELVGFACAASDGPIGKVDDFYFDDRSWQVRVLVFTAGEWLAGRKVLIPSRAVNDVAWSERRVAASTTRKRVGNSPDIELMEPVSRQHEVQRYGYYGYPPEGLQEKTKFFEAQAEMHRERGDDLDLQNFRAMLRYHIHASDGSIGHLEGMVVDDETWAIRYLEVDTSDWGLGRSVLVATTWIEDISWLDATLTVGLTKDTIRHAPAYEAVRSLDRTSEERLHAHYDRPGYWMKATG
jgi:hypothetical protein